MQQWEGQGGPGQGGTLINRMRYQPVVRSYMFETSLYKARNKVLRQYIPMVLSLAAFLADREDSRVSV